MSSAPFSNMLKQNRTEPPKFITTTSNTNLREKIPFPLPLTYFPFVSLSVLLFFCVLLQRPLAQRMYPRVQNTNWFIKLTDTYRLYQNYVIYSELLVLVILTAVKMSIFFWVVVPCDLVGGDRLQERHQVLSPARWHDVTGQKSTTVI